MNNDTSNKYICKNTEYVTMWPWMNNTYTIIVNDPVKKRHDEIRAINKILSGEHDLPCECPRCSTKPL